MRFCGCATWGRFRLGSSFYDLYSDLDGQPSAAIVLKQTPGSNAADVIAEVKAKLHGDQGGPLPAGMDYEDRPAVYLDARLRSEKVLTRCSKPSLAGVAGGLPVPG